MRHPTGTPQAPGLNLTFLISAPAFGSGVFGFTSGGWNAGMHDGLSQTARHEQISSSATQKLVDAVSVILLESSVTYRPDDDSSALYIRTQVTFTTGSCRGAMT